MAELLKLELVSNFFATRVEILAHPGLSYRRS
jgi:hypothetical protein